MVPHTILKLSLMTLAMGARQLVVQDALEITWCFAGSYLSSLTPNTMVMSSLLAGAVMMTFFTGPRRCCLASSALVNLPVDSTTTCAPTAIPKLVRIPILRFFLKDKYLCTHSTHFGMLL